MSIIGKRFGRWLVKSIGEPYVFPSTGHITKRYICECDCGSVKTVREDTLLCGDSTSCGCYAREQASLRKTTHGMSKHRLHDVYYSMMKRCNNQKAKDYKHYGGRGISVCEEWSDRLTGFKTFVDDMYGTFEEGLELDRIDVNGNYCKENCRWATRRTQVINRRKTGGIFDANILTFDGKSMCISEWSDHTGIHASVISDRITKLGWSIEKALTEKVKVKTYYILANGKMLYTSEVFKTVPNVFALAKKNGMSIQEFLPAVFYGQFKVFAIINKQEVELKPTTDLRHLQPKIKFTQSFAEILQGVINDN